MTANFDTLPRAEFFSLLTMKLLSRDLFYVNNMCAKLEGQNIYTKIDIHNLPTCIIVREISLLPPLTPFQGMKNCFLP